MQQKLIETLNYIDKLQSEVKSLRSLNKEQINQIKDYYKIGLTYSSNALEGNTLTESETKVILEDGLTVGGKPLKDTFEAIGHAQAYQKMQTLALQHGFTEDNIKDIHKLFYWHIDPNRAGNYRTEQVYITGSKHPVTKPNNIAEKMYKFVKEFQNFEGHPVEHAALVHKGLVFIHPFFDGNGRVARLLMNLILIQNQFPVTIIPPLLRNEYIRVLEKAHDNDIEFKLFIAQCVKESLLDYLRLFS